LREYDNLDASVYALGMSIRLNPLDTAWLFTESRATPNHVGGLLTFALPEDAPHDYMRQMMLVFRNHSEFQAPWNRKLKYPFNLNPVPEWVEDRKIDLEYHVRHSALPWPGGERELGELVGRLQGTPLDLTRPPWECTIIEGLEGGRFALFVKIHHSLIDGVSGMKLLQRAMATDAAKSLKIPPFWASLPEKSDPNKPHKPKRSNPTLADAMATSMASLGDQARNIPQLAMAFTKMIQRVGQGGDGMAVPFDAPRSVLNGRVREKRRFATQQFSLDRLKDAADAGGCTINDIVLAICGGALRRFLDERGQLPAKSLTAGIPVSVRPKDDTGTGNAISFIVSTLGTDEVGPVQRLEAIKASVKHAKAHVQSLPRAAMQQYTMLLMAPTLITMLTGIGGRIRPMFNITISNVRGPDKPLFFMGAELLATYPASIVTHGQAINITCHSYAGTMNFGYTACHSSLPSMQKIAVYSEDALQELEKSLGVKPLKATKSQAAPSKTSPASKAKSARKAAAA
jgi:diacylglycerol O-acyltransferase / wax synthase